MRWLGAIVTRVVAVLVLLGAVVWPALGSDSSSSSSGTEDTTITAYDADFVIDRAGTMHAQEQLTVRFPTEHHGIFRFFDLRDPSDSRARRLPYDVTVTQDGRPAQIDTIDEAHGRYRVVRIGDPTALLPVGLHRYVISYAIDHVLEPGTTGQTSQFYWNLIPGGWQQPIQQATLTVHLPVASPASVLCAVGADAVSGCTASGTGTPTLVVRTTNLPPDTPVTLKTGVAVPTPPSHDPWWTQRWDVVLGPSIGAALLRGILALLALLGGLVLSLRTREPRPPFPLMYAPPDGVGPAQGAYLLEERTQRSAFVASLMQAAEKGAASLDHTGEGWTLTYTGDTAAWRGLDVVTGTATKVLLGADPSFTASGDSVNAGRKLHDAMTRADEATTRWALEHGFLAKSGLGSGGGVLVVVTYLLGLGIAVWQLFGATADGLVPGLFAIGASALLAGGSATRRTPTGRELWSRLGGFRRILSTPSSVQRFDFSGRQDLYTAFLPWAVAFGCAKQWAAKYRTEVGSEPPVPTYFAGGYAGAYVGDSIDQMVHDFSSTVSSAVSSYEATQHASSSGGGGFSGGGGGGGGGGGSW